MSVSQVKKRIAELREYLNRDKEGIKRLDLVKDEVTELRKGLAAANEATQLAVTIKDAARERADVAEAALQEAKLELHALRQHAGSLMRDLDTVTRVEVPVEKETVGSDEAAEIKAVIKALRRKSRFCPNPLGQLRLPKERAAIYERDDIAIGWSHDSIWILGATVALLSTLLGQVAINSTERLRDKHLDTDDDGLARLMIEWLSRHNISKERNATSNLYDAASMQQQAMFRGDV